MGWTRESSLKDGWGGTWKSEGGPSIVGSGPRRESKAVWGYSLLDLLLLLLLLLLLRRGYPLRTTTKGDLTGRQRKRHDEYIKI